MIERSVTQDDLVRLKQDRDDADRRYNDALTALDASVQVMPELPHPPPGPDENQITPINERWNILAAAKPMPTGWRGRITRFIWAIVEPVFAQQHAFNSAVVDHLNRNIVPAREVPKAIASTVELVRQQIELAIRFQSHVIVFAQQITPFVDTKDYEFFGLGKRVNEDAHEAAARVQHRLQELLDNEIPYLRHIDELQTQHTMNVERRIDDVAAAGRGIAAGMSGMSDEMLKRFESATTRAQRFEASLSELNGTVISLQQLTQMLRRELERAAHRVPGVPEVQVPGVQGAAAQNAGGAQQLLASDPLHSHQYVGFEDLYRGSEHEIRERMIDYAGMFDGASDVLDIGCGRGEFLSLLKERGVSARGIDLNHEMVARCRAEGLDVTEADALGYLQGLPDESLGGLIATQVVEHLPPDYLLRLLTTAFDKLRPNARLVLETINPGSWAAFFDSYIRDLTHVRPVHPDTLKYLVTASGFADTTISWRSPYPPDNKLQPLGETVRATATADTTLKVLVETFDRNVERLNGLFFTYMDYAVIARRP